MISQPVFRASWLPSLWFSRTFLIQSCLLLMFALPFAQARATPVTFNFTGTVTEYTLAEGGLWKDTFTPAEWLGKSVSGSVTIDLAQAIYHNLQDPYHKIFGTDWEGEPTATNWVSFSIVAPDGVRLDLPGPIVPTIPLSSVNESYVELQVSSPYRGSSMFYVQRTLDYIPDYPWLAMSLSLSGRGIEGAALTNGVELEDLVIQPQFANWTNVGSVIYRPVEGVNYEFGFRLDAIWRANHSVPESGGLMLMALALGGLVLRRGFAR